MLRWGCPSHVFARSPPINGEVGQKERKERVVYHLVDAIPRQEVRKLCPSGSVDRASWLLHRVVVLPNAQAPNPSSIIATNNAFHRENPQDDCSGWQGSGQGYDVAVGSTPEEGWLTVQTQKIRRLAQLETDLRGDVHVRDVRPCRTFLCQYAKYSTSVLSGISALRGADSPWLA